MPSARRVDLQPGRRRRRACASPPAARRSRRRRARARGGTAPAAGIPHPRPASTASSESSAPSRRALRCISSRVHRVVDQHIDALQELDQLVAPVGRHVVAARPVPARCPSRTPCSPRRPSGSAGSPGSCPDAAAGSPRTVNPSISNAPRPPVTVSSAASALSGTGKHRRIHLPAQNRLQRHVRLAPRRRSAPSCPGEQRLEVRQPLDVIPVGVRQQDLARSSRPFCRSTSSWPSARIPRAGVEDHQLVAAPGDGDARACCPP